MEAAAHDHNEPVDVTIGVTDEDNNTTENRELKIPGGPTEVPTLKQELGIPGAKALWVVKKNGKKKALADHETHNVKEGDHYEALVKGGIS